MISQAEAQRLMDLVKIAADNNLYQFPGPGDKITIPLLSFDGRENFILDVNRARLKLTKCTYQERYRNAIILIRLDLDGRPHTNPIASDSVPSHFLPYNGQRILCPHVHLYVEGYEDKWAMPANDVGFSNTNDLLVTLEDFMDYCNINIRPIIQGSLI